MDGGEEGEGLMLGDAEGIALPLTGGVNDTSPSAGGAGVGAPSGAVVAMPSISGVSSAGVAEVAGLRAGLLVGAGVGPGVGDAVITGFSVDTGVWVGVSVGVATSMADESGTSPPAAMVDVGGGVRSTRLPPDASTPMPANTTPIPNTANIAARFFTRSRSASRLFFGCLPLWLRSVSIRYRKLI